MKKTAVIIFLLGLILSACDTGIQPNVAQQQEVTPIATESENAEASQHTDTATEQTEPIEETVQETSEEEVVPEAEQEETEQEEEQESEEATSDESTDEDLDEVGQTTDEDENSEEDSPELGQEDSAVDLPVIAPVEGTEALPVISLPTVTDSAYQVDEVRGIWLSYLELQPMLSGGEAAYRSSIDMVMKNATDLHLNTVYFQTRPFGDALYKSSLFPSSYVVTGTEGETLSFDPLQIAIEAADKYGLRIEAWINPYRVRNASSMIPLSGNNIAKEWFNDGSRRVLQTEEGIMVYNPALEEVRNRIVAGVKEVLDHYAVDGIHFDDYFYPTTDAGFDEVEYLSFTYDDDTLTKDDFRRQNVNKLVSEVYTLVNSYNRDLVFGISPQGGIDTNYNYLYADVALWVKTPGYIDYICPQVYYGFEHGRTPYDTTLDEWHALPNSGVDIIAGIAAYKVGAVDKWAGDGSDEWINSERILQQMIETSRMDSHHGGYALYRYDFLFKPSAELETRIQDEIDGIKATLTY